jgi:hypothetical protein
MCFDPVGRCNAMLGPPERNILVRPLSDHGLMRCLWV